MLLLPIMNFTYEVLESAPTTPLSNTSRTLAKS
ncbi:hypothetical protein SAMN05444355_103126 [Flavobacterium frigoris]|uniref:Uncharacterized protein n=1 Tax=Flavobacterium frigoris TaxID=229204 RepID=A0A1H9HFL6_FLAFI|nr:hypothetical protein SAMN05444355_103126 [Flavobacterium frigoris]